MKGWLTPSPFTLKTGKIIMETPFFFFESVKFLQEFLLKRRGPRYTQDGLIQFVYVKVDGPCNVRVAGQ